VYAHTADIYSIHMYIHLGREEQVCVSIGELKHVARLEGALHALVF
jgi:hypothetical protein